MLVSIPLTLAVLTYLLTYRMAPRLGHLDVIGFTARDEIGHPIKPWDSDYCLDWGNMIAQISKCEDAKSTQLWLYNVDGKPGEIRSSDGHCLDNGGSSVHIWKCESQGAIAENQMWIYNTSTYSIHHISSMKTCLQIIWSPDRVVSLQPCDQSIEDQWWDLTGRSTTMQSNKLRVSGLNG